MNRDGQICVAQVDNSWVIRLEGDLRADRGAAFLKLVHEIADGIDCQSQVVVDFADARLLDSTILGHLAKLAILIKDNADKTPVFVNLPNDIRHVVNNMGFELIADLDVNDVCIEIPSSLSAIEDLTETKRQGLQRVLAAHQLLASLSEENEAKFKDVIEHLRSAVRAERELSR